MKRHLWNLPFLLESLLLICVVLASCNNGLYFLRSVEFTTSTWDAFCISAIFTIAPMILSHFVLAGLGQEARRRAERVLKIISIPSCCVALLMFAYCFGRAQEVTGLFEQAPGLHIPVWVVVFFSMELESLASIAMFSSLSQQYRSLFPKRPVESSASVETRIYLGRSDHFSAVCTALRVRLEAGVTHHEADASDYVRRYLAAYRLARLQIASETEAHTAQAKLESMQERLKIAS